MSRRTSIQPTDAKFSARKREDTFNSDVAKGIYNPWEIYEGASEFDTLFGPSKPKPKAAVVRRERDPSPLRRLPPPKTDDEWTRRGDSPQRASSRDQTPPRSRERSPPRRLDSRERSPPLRRTDERSKTPPRRGKTPPSKADSSPPIRGDSLPPRRGESPPRRRADSAYLSPPRRGESPYPSPDDYGYRGYGDRWESHVILSVTLNDRGIGTTLQIEGPSWVMEQFEDEQGSAKTPMKEHECLSWLTSIGFRLDHVTSPIIFPPLTINQALVSQPPFSFRSYIFSKY